MFIDANFNKHIICFIIAEEIFIMTDKELSKLKRTELLELMLYMREEIDNLQKENEELKKQISDNGINRSMLEKIMKAVCRDDEPEKSDENVKAALPENDDEISAEKTDLTVDSGESETAETTENIEETDEENNNEKG